jgi:prepilin-type processing-associated H-X9-DG protein
VLAALLLPALGKTKEAGKTIRCASNLKQLCNATFQYLNDANDYLPTSNGAYSSTYYGVLLAPYLGYGVSSNDMGKLPNKITVCSSDKKDMGDALAYPSRPIISNYVGTLTVNKAADVPSSPYGGWMHHFNCAEQKRLNMISDNSVLMIEMPASCAWGTGIFPYAFSMSGYTNANLSPGYSGAQWAAPFWHSNMCNFLFKDGHVERLKRGTLFNNDWQRK